MTTACCPPRLPLPLSLRRLPQRGRRRRPPAGGPNAPPRPVSRQGGKEGGGVDKNKGAGAGSNPTGFWAAVGAREKKVSNGDLTVPPPSRPRNAVHPPPLYLRWWLHQRGGRYQSQRQRGQAVRRFAQQAHGGVEGRQVGVRPKQGQGGTGGAPPRRRCRRQPECGQQLGARRLRLRGGGHHEDGAEIEEEALAQARLVALHGKRGRIPGVVVFGGPPPYLLLLHIRGYPRPELGHQKWAQ